MQKTSTHAIALQNELFGIENPCIQVCEMTKKGYCKGCLRNRTERELWYKMTDNEKREVLRLLYQRRLKLQKAQAKSATPLSPDFADAIDNTAFTDNNLSFDF